MALDPNHRNDRRIAHCFVELTMSYTDREFDIRLMRVRLIIVW